MQATSNKKNGKKKEPMNPENVKLVVLERIRQLGVKTDSRGVKDILPIPLSSLLLFLPKEWRTLSKKVNLDEYGHKMINITMAAVQKLLAENIIEVRYYLDERRGRHEFAIMLKILQDSVN